MAMVFSVLNLLLELLVCGGFLVVGLLALRAAGKDPALAGLKRVGFAALIWGATGAIGDVLDFVGDQLWSLQAELDGVLYSLYVTADHFVSVAITIACLLLASMGALALVRELTGRSSAPQS